MKPNKDVCQKATESALESCLISPNSMMSVFQSLTGGSGGGDLPSDSYLHRSTSKGESPFSLPYHNQTTHHSQRAASKRPLSNGIASSSPSAPSSLSLSYGLHSSSMTTTTTTAYGCLPFPVHNSLSPLKLEIPNTTTTTNGNCRPPAKKAKTLLTCLGKSDQVIFHSRHSFAGARTNLRNGNGLERQRNSLESHNSSSSSNSSRASRGSSFHFRGPETSPEVLRSSSSTDSSSFIFTDSEQESDL